jgi:hypothetical protein
MRVLLNGKVVLIVLGRIWRDNIDEDRLKARRVSLSVLERFERRSDPNQIILDQSDAVKAVSHALVCR